jgi:signal transduction histidine kinase
MTIAARIRLVACALVVATALSVALVEYWGYRSLVAGQQRESLDRQVESEALRLESALLDVEGDVNLLANLPAVAGAIAAHRHGDAAAEAEWKDRIAKVFADLLRANAHYAQARYIGSADGGRELVRVQRGPEGPVRVPEEALQRKGSSDYFRDVIDTPLGRVYFSEVNLNREHGRIELPHRAMLRVALPVHTRVGDPFGIVILNVDFLPFVEELFPARVGRYTYYLTNALGDYLLHPDPTHTFGFDLGVRYRAQDEFPGLAPLYDSKAIAYTVREGSSWSGTGRLLSFRKIFPDPERPLALGIAASYDDITEQTLMIEWGALALTALLLLVAAVSAYYVGSVLTAPVASITAAVLDYDKGTSPARLPVERSDEIGILARAFEQTMQTVKERESQLLATARKLQEANADLEHFAYIASHDLREPARRVAGLADRVLLKEAAQLSAEGLDLLERMRGAAVKMLDQITDFRALTKIGHGALVRSDLALDELVRAALQDFAAELERRAVVVELDQLPRVRAYANLLQLLYFHLIANALEHAESNGFTLAFTARREGAGWVFGVRNSASQLREEDLERIFAPFTKLRPGSESSGLGLSICKRIVERHAGRIWAQSGVGYVHIEFTLGGETDDA